MQSQPTKSFKEELGHATWLWLHRFTCLHPTETFTFCEIIRHMCMNYPCVQCRKQLCDIVKQNQWLTENKTISIIEKGIRLHSNVNQRLHRRTIWETRSVKDSVQVLKHHLPPIYEPTRFTIQTWIRTLVKQFEPFNPMRSIHHRQDSDKTQKA